jgi:hypothetical protein
VDCPNKATVNDPVRVACERDKEIKTDESERILNASSPGADLGEASQRRGVTIEWLLQWTSERNCWDMPTWKVRRLFVIPQTKPLRCRYVALLPHTARGPAATFVRYAFHISCDLFLWTDNCMNQSYMGRTLGRSRCRCV